MWKEIYRNIDITLKFALHVVWQCEVILKLQAELQVTHYFPQIFLLSIGFKLLLCIYVYHHTYAVKKVWWSNTYSMRLFFWKNDNRRKKIIASVKDLQGYQKIKWSCLLKYASLILRYVLHWEIFKIFLRNYLAPGWYWLQLYALSNIVFSFLHFLKSEAMLFAIANPLT